MSEPFEANARIPFRPLSYDNVSLAMNKEVIVNYTTGNIYVKDESGVIHDLSEQISKEIIESGQIVQYLKVTYTGFDGVEKTVLLNPAIVEIVAEIKKKANTEDLGTYLTKITPVLAENNIVLVNSDGTIKDSGKKVGGATFEATTSENTVATEKAVEAELYHKMDKANATVNHIATFASTATEANVKDSAKTIGGATLETTPSENTVATEKAVSAAISPVSTKIDSLQTAITSDTEPTTGPTIKIHPGQVITDDDHKFITKQQLTDTSNKISLNGVTATLLATEWVGDEAPYTQVVTCSGLTADMLRPTVDIQHNDTETFDEAMDMEEAWGYIYRIVTGANKFTAYASEKPEVNITMFIEIKNTGLTGV